MPFCSERCRKIDLGRWMDEEIGIPLEPGTAQQLANEQRASQAEQNQGQGQDDRDDED